MAGGKVRCGACLAIFQATDYMLSPSVSSRILTPDSTEIEPKKTAENDSADSTSVVDEQANKEILEERPSFYKEPSAEEDEPEEESELGDESEREEELEFEEEPELDGKLESDEEPEPEFESSEEPELEGEPEAELDDKTILERAIESEQKTEFEDETEQEKEANFDESDPEISDTEDFDEKEALTEFDYQNQAFDFEEEPTDFDKNFSYEQPSDDDIEPLDEDDFDDELVDDQIIDEEIESVAELDEQGLDQDEQELDLDESDFELDNEDYELDKDYDSDKNYDSDKDDELEEQDYEDLSGQLAEQMEETDSDPDPLDEFDQVVKENKVGIKSKLIFGTLIILTLVALQQVWSNRQALAWSDNWGGTIKSVCEYLPCELKAKRDIGKIKLLQRQLSPDEDQENLLDIKVLLINEADFEQPYPTIKIVFSNQNGEQVAVKSFLPEDYLDVDPKKALMPMGSEVHIGFKTEQPHPDALGFEFIFE